MYIYIYIYTYTYIFLQSGIQEARQPGSRGASQPADSCSG